MIARTLSGICLVLAAGLPGQDWAAEVERACTANKLGLKLAAARRVAAAGAVAVPALRAFQESRGRNAVPQTLVEAIAGSEHGDETVLGLLLEWARDRDFYWRAQALGGLAARKLAEQRSLLLAAVRDPAHLYRIQGARGLILLGKPDDRAKALPLLGDPDPRVRVAVAIHLADAGDPIGLPVLAAALRNDAEFLGDPWGRREALLAFKALQRALGTDGGYAPEQSAAANAKAIDLLRERAQERTGAMNLPAVDPAHKPLAGAETADFASGLEIRSCKHGDLFVRWTANGQLAFGLEGAERGLLPAEAWAALEQRARSLSGPADATLGAVVCDFVRWRGAQPARHLKCAPGSLPADLLDWLKAFAEALEKNGLGAHAAALTARMRQFAPIGSK